MARAKITGSRRATRRTKPSQIQIWKREAKLRRKAGVLSFNFIADRPWLVDFDAQALVVMLGNIVARRIYESLSTGEDPATGTRLKPPKRRGGLRMNRTGAFVNTIKRGRVLGTPTKAHVNIHPHTKYKKMLNAEFGRGHLYFRTDGKIRIEMNGKLNGFTAGALKGVAWDFERRAVKASTL